jgi:multiple antibiotic resistance protein
MEGAGDGFAMQDFLLNAVVTLLVTIDPFGLVPIFIVVTAGMGPAARRRAALRATVTAAIVLVAFAFVGQPLLNTLGISIPAFRIAGGLLLFWIAFEMVFDLRRTRKAATADLAASAPQVEFSSDDAAHDVAIFPLAIPLIAGPGAISATILLSSRAPGYTGIAALIVIIVALTAACFAVFLLADRIDRALGATGRIVLTRLLGVILAALAIQFVADGVLTFATRAGGG